MQHSFDSVHRSIASSLNSDLVNSSEHRLIRHDLEASFLEIQSHEAATVYGGIPAPKTDASSPSDASAISINRPSYWSVSLQNVLDQPPSNLPARLMVGGLVFCCAFASWAWFGRMQEVSYAQGRLVPKGEIYKVQPVTQGEIARITVEEGQHVEAGQVIAVLDSRLAQVEIDRLNQSLNAYRLELVQTQGLIDRTHMEIDARRAITAAEVRSQEAAIAQALTTADTHEAILNQLDAKIASYEARLDRLQPLLQEGAIAHEYVFDAEQSLQEQLITATQSQGEFQQAIEEARRLRAELEQRQATGLQSELETQQRLQQLEVEISQLRAKIAETETLLKAAQTRLEQMYLYAPVEGTVSALKIRNVGEVMQPGQTIAEIAPEGVPLILSATLPNREAGLVKEGMDVQIKFDAFPYQDYGIVSGQVMSISPDATLDDQQGAVYRVEIAVEQEDINDQSVQHAVQLKAGQTAQAEIVTRQRRIIEVILDPIRQLQEGGINF
ncbi:MAG: HlyD family type I secretion periplasmic adaptor subunit [Cyanobacteria bacterium CRU_2_1]|nr:HlyD family type I secretion periplasmic adaptor subunit [Cyanobacteria bacterium RU_5_0]NJR61250.1 HlyD family type I secretion periplasmic adaptor subunit [Cyanobacteria bacterium CRU_2_1]